MSGFCDHAFEDCSRLKHYSEKQTERRDRRAESMPYPEEIAADRRYRGALVSLRTSRRVGVAARHLAPVDMRFHN